jgi:Skp family chaperone for outer membrane proteins
MRPARLALLIPAFTLLPLLAPAAASAQATKIAVVSVERVFNEVQELKDYKQKLENDTQNLNAQLNARKQKIAQLESERSALRPDSPQYAEKNKEWLSAQIEAKSWFEISRASQEMAYKQKIVETYTKVQETIAAVAKDRGVDLVIATQNPNLADIIEKANLQQLEAVIGQRDVLYADPKADITSDVLAKLDATYKAK